MQGSKVRSEELVKNCIFLEIMEQINVHQSSSASAVNVMSSVESLPNSHVLALYTGGTVGMMPGDNG